MKKVLMISYVFPPTGGSGVQRSMYFAKYLPEFEYEPCVVCGRPRSKGGVTDPRLLSELGRDLNRMTVPCIEPACLFRPIGRFCAQFGRIGKGIAWRIGSVNDWVEKLLSPDALLPWARWYAGRVATWARSQGVSLIYSTSDPYSNHLLAWLVHRQLRLPWVADFRDLWTTDWMYDRIHRRVTARDQRYEHMFLTNASAVVSVTEGYCDELRQLAPQGHNSKVCLIRNGVDLATFPDPHGLSPRDGLQVGYVGIMYDAGWSEAFVTALREVNQEVSCSVARKWRWVVAGKMSKTQRAAAAKLGDDFDYLGYVPVSRARELMVESDLLLIQIIRGENAHGNVPGKLYEYLASGRPILCLQPKGVESETAKLVRRHNAGYVCEMEDQPAIERVLREVAGRKEAGEPARGARWEEIGQYDRRELSRRLAGVFDTVTR
jgi:hypothetical protein